MKKIWFILFLLIWILHINTYAQTTEVKTAEDYINEEAAWWINSQNETNKETAWWTDWQNTTKDDATVNWITIGSKCLINGQCKFNVYDTLGIRKSIRADWDPTSVWLFVQDIILAATTFIGTILTIAIIVSGLMYIFAAASGKDPAKAKTWLINSFIWLLIVILSYSIIRLIQYLAKGI